MQTTKKTVVQLLFIVHLWKPLYIFKTRTPNRSFDENDFGQ